ncbi:MAG: hypothetical protein IJ362_02075 [Oscillospiraceae bacterium]|nr:hypothetical protein [Oscillospiraceae bacterium]
MCECPPRLNAGKAKRVSRPDACTLQTAFSQKQNRHFIGTGFLFLELVAGIAAFACGKC